jgi:thiamine pyrophosphate-dependent acetolactate synthase large subunit-like protein
VSKTSQFQEAFEQAAASSTPSLIELVVSEQAISPAFTLDELVERSIAAQKG